MLVERVGRGGLLGGAGVGDLLLRRDWLLMSDDDGGGKEVVVAAAEAEEGCGGDALVITGWDGCFVGGAGFFSLPCITKGGII